VARKVIALTIAGSDPSGGAGIQADLKTFHQFGVYGAAVLTLITVQNTQAVTRVEPLDPDLVAAQIRAVIDDIPPRAAKTGALGTAAIVEAVAAEAASFNWPLVVDPVMVSKHGAPLLDPAAQVALRTRLLPYAALVTPNLPEAEALSGIPIPDVAAARQAARRILDLGPRAVLIKGGHFDDSDHSTDLLLTATDEQVFTAARIATRHTHGTGCTYSAAITALLAQGRDLPSAVEQAKSWLTRAIASNPGLGQGQGPVNHLTPLAWE
jgi:hydroxymethylpyrimidine/phosphomethylpyrimidine kinase